MGVCHLWMLDLLGLANGSEMPWLWAIARMGRYIELITPHCANIQPGDIFQVRYERA